MQVKEPNSSLHDYLYNVQCVQCTPAHNPREREGVVVCIERKKERQFERKQGDQPITGV